jgi:hypothetical protein
LRQKQRVEQKHHVMDIYEVEVCRRGRWEQQDARFVAARDVDEAAYKVVGRDRNLADFMNRKGALA